MRDWLRTVLEVNFHDSTLLDHIQDFREAPSFPGTQEITRKTVSTFLASLAPPTEERLNVRGRDPTAIAICDWTFSLCVLVPHRLDVTDEMIDSLFGVPR